MEALLELNLERINLASCIKYILRMRRALKKNQKMNRTKRRKRRAIKNYKKVRNLIKLE